MIRDAMRLYKDTLREDPIKFGDTVERKLTKDEIGGAKRATSVEARDIAWIEQDKARRDKRHR